MTLHSQDYAELAEHSYDRQGNLAQLVNQTVALGGVEYKILAYADKPSGYQGTIYQRTDTGEIVVAHRGTEFEREKFKDLIATDGIMVAGRTNLQANDAIELTRHAVQEAEKLAVKRGGEVPEVTVTGHSLGGTLAQISAHHFGLKGETFNAYGAASLDRRIPEGDNAVLNHVMAADLVSSGSPHYGQVRVYTNQREIDTLERYGYGNDRSRFDLRRPVSAAVSAISSGSHDMHNFLPIDGQGRADRSILADPQARRLAQQYDPMIDKYRDDVGTIRRNATAGLRGPTGLLDDAFDRMRGDLPAGEPGRNEQRRDDPRSWSDRAPPYRPPVGSTGDAPGLFGPDGPLGELPGYAAPSVPRIPLRAGASTGTDASEPPTARDRPADMRDADHPANGKYRQAYAGVTEIDRSLGRTPDGASERLAAALTAAGAVLTSISQVALSRDGSRAFALDAGRGEVRDRVHVDVATAVQRPVEASTQDWQLASQQLMRQQQEQLTREQVNPAMRGPAVA